MELHPSSEIKSRENLKGKKVKLSACKGNRGLTPLIINLCARWRSLVCNTPQAIYTPHWREPSTHCVRGWMGPTASLENLEKRKIPCLCRDLNPGLSSL